MYTEGPNILSVSCIVSQSVTLEYLLFLLDMLCEAQSACKVC